jgi:pyruvate,orthophosphate dikinase
MVGTFAELKNQADVIRATAEQVFKERGQRIDFLLVQ